jgi:hypothetical protein
MEWLGLAVYGFVMSFGLWSWATFRPRDTRVPDRVPEGLKFIALAWTAAFACVITVMATAP